MQNIKLTKFETTWVVIEKTLKDCDPNIEVKSSSFKSRYK